MLQVPRFAFAVHRLLFVDEFEYSAQQGLKENLLDELYFLFESLFFDFFWVLFCIFIGEELFLVSRQINLDIVKFNFLVCMFLIRRTIFDYGNLLWDLLFHLNWLTLPK